MLSVRRKSLHAGMRKIQNARRNLKVGDEKEQLIYGFARISKYLAAIKDANNSTIEYELQTSAPRDEHGHRVFKSLFLLIRAGLDLCADGGHPVYGLDCGAYRCSLMGCVVMILTGQAGSYHSIPFVLGVVTGEQKDTYAAFGEFCKKYGVISKIDKPTNFLWSDMDKGLDVEIPKWFENMIKCCCQLHQERALSKEFKSAFNPIVFKQLCKSVSVQQVDDSLALIESKSKKLKEKLVQWGLHKFVLYNIVKENPGTWTAGARNSNLVELIMNEMLGQDGRGG